MFAVRNAIKRWKRSNVKYIWDIVKRQHHYSPIDTINVNFLCWTLRMNKIWRFQSFGPVALNTLVANRKVITESWFCATPHAAVSAAPCGVVSDMIKRDGIQNRIPKTKAINLAYSEAYRLIHVWPMLAQCSRHRDGMPLWCLECGVTIVIT